MSSHTHETPGPVHQDGVAALLEEIWQVILHNDDRNDMDHVVRTLMRVFGHGEELAAKIMLEAHAAGRAIAEVEAETPARLHRDQLQSYGLVATIERV
jgi:ATP-dependent Clp protease adapter protein ClpS